MVSLIDGDMIPYIVSYRIEKENQSVEDIEGSISSLLLSNMMRCGFNHYLIFLSGNENFRYSIYPDYKANRKHLTKPKFYNEIVSMLKEQFSACTINGAEADDALAICSTHFGDKSVIVSRDKDLNQVAGHHFNPFTSSWVTISKEEAWRNLWFQVITGDPTDNIKGLKGYGKKKASAVLDHQDPSNYPDLVFSEYVNNDQSIDDFELNFRLVFLIRNNNHFKIPNPKSVKEFM